MKLMFCPVRTMSCLSRGVGYTILQSMAEKYGGVFTYEKQDGVYRCALSLKQA